MWQKAFFQNKQIRSKKKYPRSKSLNQGFMTLEMLIASLVGFFFLVFSLQAVVSGLAFKVVAQKEFGGDRLIQEEIERLNDLATQNSLSFIDPGIDLILNTDDDDETEKIAACDGNFDLDGDGAPNEGYAQALWNLRLEGNARTANTDPAITVAPNITNNNNIVGLPLTLVGTRNTTDPGGAGVANPFRVLGINYIVTAPDENGNPEAIAERYVEIIADEALECS